MKRVVVLGSTGSIGTQTLDVISQHPERLKVVGLAARSNEAKLREQAERFGVRRLALFEGTVGRRDGGTTDREPRTARPCTGDIPRGMSALVDLATLPEADIVVVSVAGVIGLEPTIAAIHAGKQIALASKEVLVAAGEIVMPLVREKGVAMTPIDSEHSAIFQCLQGYRSDQIQELILTASGGPFRGKKTSELTRITAKEALNHPTWSMGGKITIDSATLMNKGLETIEAHWLFGTSIDRVKVVIHPQSIVHSLVKFTDGSVLGQLGWPNMRLPIQYALLWPERPENSLPPWSPLDSPNLTFEPVDHETFPSIGLAIQAARAGGTMPCVMNAANEEAANAFLREEIGFLQIAESVQLVMERHSALPVSLESILRADAWARQAFWEALQR
ncbi:MAG: 1-deoxy-D-xylulose-5-phosphate reductoisomerase [Armatimonadetes bacterium]|nr:1-deoxy-D-xylulose-5-phosphate reductoisomerase [Armatimonadota bacterium]